MPRAGASWRHNERVSDKEIRSSFFHSRFAREGWAFSRYLDGVFEFAGDSFGLTLLRVALVPHLHAPLRWQKEGENEDEDPCALDPYCTLDIDVKVEGSSFSEESTAYWDEETQAYVGEMLIPLSPLVVSWWVRSHEALGRISKSEWSEEHILDPPREGIDVKKSVMLPPMTVVRIATPNAKEDSARFKDSCRATLAGDQLNQWQEVLPRIKRYSQLKEAGLELTGLLWESETLLIDLSDRPKLLVLASEHYRPVTHHLSPIPEVLEFTLEDEWEHRDGIEEAVTSVIVHVECSEGITLPEGTELTISRGSHPRDNWSDVIQVVYRNGGFEPESFPRSSEGDDCELWLYDRSGLAGYGPEPLAHLESAILKAGENRFTLRLDKKPLFASLPPFEKISFELICADVKLIHRSSTTPNRQFNSLAFDEFLRYLRPEVSASVERVGPWQYRCQLPTHGMLGVPESYINRFGAISVSFSGYPLYEYSYEIKKAGLYPLPDSFQLRESRSNVLLYEDHAPDKGKTLTLPPPKSLVHFTGASGGFQWELHNQTHIWRVEPGTTIAVASGEYFLRARHGSLTFDASALFIPNHDRFEITFPTQILPETQGELHITVPKEKLAFAIKEGIYLSIVSPISKRLSISQEVAKESSSQRIRSQLVDRTLVFQGLPLTKTPYQVRFESYEGDSDLASLPMQIAFSNRSPDKPLSLNFPTFYPVAEYPAFPYVDIEKHQGRSYDLDDPELGLLIEFWRDGKRHSSQVGLFPGRYEVRFWARRLPQQEAPLGSLTLRVAKDDTDQTGNKLSCTWHEDSREHLADIINQIPGFKAR